MRKKLAAIIIVLLLAASSNALLFPVKAQNKTLVVPGDYPNIASAIGNATDGDTVFIKNGTYDGPINQTIEIHKSISIIGQNSETTIIRLHPKYSVYWICTNEYYNFLSPAIDIRADDVSIANLTLNFFCNIEVYGDRVSFLGNKLNSHCDETGLTGATGLQVKGSNCQMENNVISGTVSIEGRNNIIVQNNINFGLSLQGDKNVVASNYIRGLSLCKSSNNEIRGNNITNNGNSDMAVCLLNSFENIFQKNRITNEGDGNHYIDYDVDLEESNSNTFFNNLFFNNFGIPINRELSINQKTTNFSDGNFWDNGKIGNYWSDYQTKYPNASEIGSSGIWATPYVINANNTDNYPLVNQTFYEEAAHESPPDSLSSGVLDISIVGALVAVTVAACIIGMRIKRQKIRSRAKNN
jgi:parallel beta-helix repeat protein